MKRLILPLLLLLPVTVQAAPKLRPFPITEIKLTVDSGGIGGRNAGGGMSWTLKPNGTVTRETSLTPAQTMDMGDAFIPKVFGNYNQQDFSALSKAIQSSHLFELKAPPLSDGDSFVRVDLVRGGKRKFVAVSDAANPSPACSAAWAVQQLVRGIVADTDWKDAAGHSIDTGLQGHFVFATSGPASQSAENSAPPNFDVLTAKGLKVGTVRRSNPDGYFRLVLPPGSYRLVSAKMASQSTSHFEWRPLSEVVQVEAGSLAPVKILLQQVK